jgi:mono/diheme cytochrome c family protein
MEPPKVWKIHCAACHGLDGKVTPAGKAVGARDLSDHAYMASRTQGQLKQSILYGIKDEKGNYTMIPYERILKKGELDELIQYIRSLSKEPESSD